MEREYKKTTTYVTRNGDLRKNVKVNKGLKIVHIGDDVWRVGRTNTVSDPTKKMVNVEHCVIYGPNRKEYHVYGNDINLLRTPTELNTSYKEDIGSYSNKDGNDKIEASLKVYIMTSILDERKNWIFDIKNIPQPGKLKVIYNNGTVKNIDFDGIFKSETIDKIHYYNVDEEHQEKTYKKDIYPIGYKLI